MKIEEIENHNIALLSESIDAELRGIVKELVTAPIDNLTKCAAVKLKAWALEVFHALGKGAESEKVSMRTLKAIINDPVRFTQQLITYEMKKNERPPSGI